MAEPQMTFGEENLAFYYYIGLAATQWAHVENGLYNLALVSLGRDTSKMLGPSYYSIANFRSKLGFTNEAFRASSNFDQFEGEWTRLSKHIESLSSIRNEIAHGSVIVYPQAGAGRRYAIMPFDVVEPKFPSAKAIPPSNAHCVRNIDLAARQFSRASNLLLGLCGRALGHEDPFAEHTQPELRCRELGQLARQMRAMLQRHDES